MLKEEKIQILNMVQEGKVSPEEGITLLEALENNKEEINESNSSAKWLKIRVFDPDEDTKVNVTLPITLINLGVKLAGKFSPEFKEAGLSEKDMNEIFDAIKGGATGKIVDVDSKNGERVEIVIE
ncbi:hypothetical protein KQI42_15015 [Tissierella sp. MSJ-40]|uniref:YvlB/LiaX N-terminal domain-containing protein n=1 Tax=Tissierella simiarum TaxID=2841534 RepID=A0ABS6E8S9_9FIRM|nr:hypothetical protein [Tissierella simiarum]MBU5439333.1 hypothetical protein [Tissierella simiarum]